MCKFSYEITIFKMACALSKTTRVLKNCSRILSTNLRFCSNESSKYGTSNKNFSAFSTKDNLQNFQKTPQLRTIASVILYGSCVNPKSYLFQDGISTESLLEGCVHAVEAVTQNISTENHEIMSSLLTRDCFERYEAKLPINHENLKHIGIDKEDIFFYWLGNYDLKDTKIQLCTFSLPSYHYLKDGLGNFKKIQKEVIKDVTEEVKGGQIPLNEGWKVKNERLKEADNLGLDGAQEHFDNNDIIVSNWDFVQEDGEWKIEGMAMQKLVNCISPPFHFRWKARVKTSLVINKDFTRGPLRWDYATDYLFLSVLFNLVVLAPIFAGPPAPGPP